VAAASLTLALALSIIRPGGERVRSSGADAFSRSALGHRAFAELLRATGTPVLVSRYASAERAGRSSLLIIAEPRLDPGATGRARRLAAMAGGGRTTLLVLPKWTGRAHKDHGGWVEAVEPLDQARVDRVLDAVDLPAHAVRFPEAGRCDRATAGWDWVSPQLLVPEGTRLRPLIACEKGVLLAEMATRDSGRLLVLSDPDLLSNHGLGRADNASLALAIVDLARDAGRPVVIDETLHGFERPPSLWRELFTFPLLPATIQAGVALLALVASGLGRFGAPLAVAPALTPGRALLIENTASLLAAGGHSAHSLGRYFDGTLSDLAHTLHAPPSLHGSRLLTHLADSGRRRGVKHDVRALERRVAQLRSSARPAPSAVLATAREIHGWRKEMLRGSGNHPEL